jgi:hypothetical protein
MEVSTWSLDNFFVYIRPILRPKVVVTWLFDSVTDQASFPGLVGHTLVFKSRSIIVVTTQVGNVNSAKKGGRVGRCRWRVEIGSTLPRHIFLICIIMIYRFLSADWWRQCARLYICNQVENYFWDILWNIPYNVIKIFDCRPIALLLIDWL